MKGIHNTLPLKQPAQLQMIADPSVWVLQKKKKKGRIMWSFSQPTIDISMMEKETIKKK